jgi:hypothetical protein
MARFIKLSARGGETFVNVDLITSIGTADANKDACYVRFDKDNSLTVMESVASVMKAIGT